jgi:hypothetical protein
MTLAERIEEVFKNNANKSTKQICQDIASQLTKDGLFTKEQINKPLEELLSYVREQRDSLLESRKEDSQATGLINYLSNQIISLIHCKIGLLQPIPSDTVILTKGDSIQCHLCFATHNKNEGFVVLKKGYSVLCNDCPQNLNPLNCFVSQSQFDAFKKMTFISKEKFLEEIEKALVKGQSITREEYGIEKCIELKLKTYLEQKRKELFETKQ